MKKTVIIFGVLMAGCFAFADDSVLAPQDFLNQVLDFIKSFGGLAWYLKVAGIITLLVSTMKVSFLNQLIWSKLGAAKTWVAPAFGLIAGLLMLGTNGHITLAAVMAYVGAGGGAIYIHELLDTLKAVPGLGDFYVQVIVFIEKALGGPDQSVLTIRRTK